MHVRKINSVISHPQQSRTSKSKKVVLKVRKSFALFKAWALTATQGHSIYCNMEEYSE